MSQQNINNGTFDNDASADKIRIAFDDVQANFTEQYTTLPQLDPATLAAQNGKILVVNSAGTAFELVALAGGGDLLSSNDLSDINDASQGRLNLGLGSAAVRNIIDEDNMSSDSETALPSQQSVKAYVDATAKTYQAGTGISIQTTTPFSPASPGIVNNETNDYVTEFSFAPATGILTATLLGEGTVTINLSAYTVLRIGGFETKKGSGNTNFAAHEVGDYCHGWDGDRFVAFKIAGLPISTESNRSYALENEI